MNWFDRDKYASWELLLISSYRRKLDQSIICQFVSTKSAIVGIREKVSNGTTLSLQTKKDFLFLKACGIVPVWGDLILSLIRSCHAIYTSYIGFRVHHSLSQQQLSQNLKRTLARIGSLNIDQIWKWIRHCCHDLIGTRIGNLRSFATLLTGVLWSFFWETSSLFGPRWRSEAWKWPCEWCNDRPQSANYSQLSKRLLYGSGGWGENCLRSYENCKSWGAQEDSRPPFILDNAIHYLYVSPE